MLTGEPLPVSKRAPDKVIGATLNTSGSLVIRAGKVGAATMLAQIVQMVAQAQRSKAPMQRMADVVSGYFIAVVVSIALLSFFAWGLFGGEQGWVFGLINGVSVLTIACPCALGLATPMSIMVATGKAATQGILFSDAATIEHLRRIDTLIVDKTGTLTEGHQLRAGLCKGFIEGVIAAGDRRLFCVPAGACACAYRDRLDFSLDDPANAERSARELVEQDIAGVWPCRGGKSVR